MSQTLSQLPVGALIVDPNTKYYNSPIVWMVLEHGHDGAGNTTLLAEKILTLKCFDAKEPNNSNSDRKNYGNNRYSVSNIRQWLNSDASAGNWYSAQHTADQTPNSTNVSYNSYDTQVGFLNGFSADFKALLQNVAKTVAKNTVTDGGGSETVTNKIFLLSETEVGLGNENNIAEGTQYTYFTDTDSRKCKCTAEAIANSNYSSNPTVNDNWHWWLRSPYASNAISAHDVYDDGTLNYDRAYFGYFGVRPACAIPSDTKVSDSPNANGYYEIRYNSSPIITLSSTSLGQVTTSPTISFTVDDEDNNLASLTVALDGTLHTTVDLSSITLNTPTSFSLTSEEFDALSNSSHTLTFTATDTEGETTTVTCTFTKFVRPTKDRIMNHDDALNIISALESIRDKRIARKFDIPTQTDKNLDYTGSEYNFLDHIEGFDSQYMFAYGDLSGSDNGAYFVTITLKSLNDAWSDLSREDREFMFIVGTGTADVSWANASDEMLVKLVKMSDEGKIDLAEDCGWAVGDVRSVNLSAMTATGVGESHVAQTVQFAIVAVDTGVEDVSNPCWNYQYVEKHGIREWPKVIVQQVNGLANGTSGEVGYMNSSNTNLGSWNSCARRTWCNSVYKTSIPSTIVSIFRQVKVKTIATYNGSVIQESEDYFFLPAEKEILGSVTNSNSNEGSSLSQWSYYAVSSNRYKKTGPSGSGYPWWLRSPYKSSTTDFSRIDIYGGANYTTASTTQLIAPAACI